jgi:hypothetical protein
MNKERSSTDAASVELVQAAGHEASHGVKMVLETHKEALIIVADPDASYGGESNIAVFSKLLNQKGVISPMLKNILSNILATSDGHQQGSL